MVEIDYKLLTESIRKNISSTRQSKTVKGIDRELTDLDFAKNKLEYAGDFTCEYCKKPVTDQVHEIKGAGCRFYLNELELHMLEKHVDMIKRKIDKSKGVEYEFIYLEYPAEGKQHMIRVDNLIVWMKFGELDKGLRRGK